MLKHSDNHIADGFYGTLTVLEVHALVHYIVHYTYIPTVASASRLYLSLPYTVMLITSGVVYIHTKLLSNVYFYLPIQSTMHMLNYNSFLYHNIPIYVPKNL